MAWRERMATLGQAPSLAARPTAPARHPSQFAVLVVGVVYVVVGAAGFLVDGGSGGGRLLGFELGLVHNLVRVNAGLLGLLMWAEQHTARVYGRLLAVGYGLTVLVGLFDGGQIGIPPVAGPDGVLHLGNAIAAQWPRSGRLRANLLAGRRSKLDP